MTKEQALAFAEKYGLEFEVELMINSGCTPEEALSEWDII